MIEEAESGEDYNFQETKKEVSKAQRELEKLSMTPSFILDNRVPVILKALFQAASQRIGDERQNDFYSYYVRVYEEIKQSITEIDKLARKELKVKN